MKQPSKKVNQKTEPLFIAAKKPACVTEKASAMLRADVTEALLHFMEYHPAKRLNKNLRTMLIDFLMFEGATEMRYLNDLLYDVNALFTLLDAIEGKD